MPMIRSNQKYLPKFKILTSKTNIIKINLKQKLN